MTSWAISPEVIKVDSKEAQSNIACNESQNLIQKCAVNSERQAINRFISRHDQLTVRTECQTNEIHSRDDNPCVASIGRNTHDAAAPS